MGIEFHADKFLRYCVARQPLKSVATLGRQHLLLPEMKLKFGRYCEPMLVSLGAELVESYDASGYEGATRIADFNLPLHPPRLYDTVIDCGTVEHIFDIAQALKNISALCAVGGQVIHVAPANNFCGHGFWQLSPELFFSFYSKANGFSDIEVYTTTVKPSAFWFRVSRPANGARVEVMSSEPIYILCRAVKRWQCPIEVQQSDYIVHWSAPGQDLPKKAYVRWLSQHPGLYKFAYDAKGQLARWQRNGRCGLNSRNPHLARHRIADLLQPS